MDKLSGTYHVILASNRKLINQKNVHTGLGTQRKIQRQRIGGLAGLLALSVITVPILALSCKLRLVSFQAKLIFQDGSECGKKVGILYMKFCSDVHTMMGTSHIKICSDVQNRVGTLQIKMCLNVQNRMGTQHIKMCSDVPSRVGTPHIKICSDVQNRLGTLHIKMCSDV